MAGTRVLVSQLRETVHHEKRRGPEGIVVDTLRALSVVELELGVRVGHKTWITIGPANWTSLKRPSLNETRIRANTFWPAGVLLNG